MRTQIGSRFVLTVALGWLALSGVTLKSQGTSEAIKKPETLIYSVKGPDLYHAYCAACHGLDGKGDGPVAPALKKKPANLTVLAKISGGKYPGPRVREFISGEVVVAAHGSREMPIWGPIFHQIEEDQDLGNVRLQNLTKYIESIQQK